VARRPARFLFAVPLLAGALGLLASAAGLRAAEREVIVLPATGIVDNVLAGYLADGVARAERDGAAAVVIRLNTPGGSLEATNEIVGTLLDASVPTIVWVAPSGGRAASAGTFITLAAGVALMAPGTSIGAASPVGGSGEDIEGTIGDKVKNDAIAKIRAIAERRERNVEWAIETVDIARSSAASEAVELGAVDGIAETLDDVLAFANGREVSIPGGTVVIDLEGATPVEVAMNPFQAFLHLLSDPNIAFILFTIGFYGLLFELQNPNFVTGILGALMIILAFIGFGSLPLNVAGLLLIALAIVLFVLEFTVTSHGLLGIGGIVCFFLGASALYTVPGDPTAPLVGVAFPLLAVSTATTAVFVALIAFAAIRTRRMADEPAGLVGARLPAGTVGVVRSPLNPLGSVFAAGEEWTARSSDSRALPRGTPVHVVGVDGLTAVVEPDPDAGT
jgi:membrane-bound serine protease (ClpP class)